MLTIYFIFSILQVFTATFIFFSSNPIHSILLLILLFFEVAVVLSLLKLEFISLLFILVYVGAIAVLFLFVVMMLRVKLNDLEILTILPISLALNFYIYVSFLSQFQPFTYYSNAFYSDLFLCFSSVEENITEIFTLGQVIYNYYIICFLIAGLILLLALVGAIVLSLDFNKSRLNGVVFRKLSRTSNFVSFFQ
jgi:NADH-quinone oxidoreductase subunit J